MSTEAFTLHHFACTGERGHSCEMHVSRLSKKWIDVGTGLLSGGPILTKSLDGLLDGYQVKFTVGICHCSVAGALAFSAIMLPLGPEDQNEQLLSVFGEQLAALQEGGGAAALQAEMASVVHRPACVVIDWLNASIPEEDCEAMFQFLYHFAAAYFLWRDDT